MIVTRRSGEHRSVNDKLVSHGSDPVQLVLCTQSGSSPSVSSSRNKSTAQQNKEITKQEICEGNQPLKGFKEGICKCGEKYLYMGLDFGLCIKCIDKMEITKEFEKGLGIKESEFTKDDKEVLEDTKEFMEINKKIKELF